MRINDTVAAAYLAGEDVGRYRSEWFYSASAVAGSVGKNIFTAPPADAAAREKVRAVCDALCRHAQQFQPSNLPVWDALFSDWREVLDDVTVNLIVGFPEPYDAAVEYDPSGRCHIIFDLVCWTKYIGQGDLASIAQNLLTHELCHVLIHRHTDGLAADAEHGDYRTRLDAVTFDEGLAHLLSYSAAEIGTVDWHSETLARVYERSRDRMRAALAETDPAEQEKNLYDALCGNYYDKYACMCGMLTLADRWLAGGVPALREAFAAGYRGFAERAAGVR